MIYVLLAAFLISLLVSLITSAAFTRRLEVLSDHFHFSPGLLSFLGALGANIPNYVASLVAASAGQVGIGLGIIIGSNIYNVAIILAIAAFASPDRRGLILSWREARDARQIGLISLALLLCTVLASDLFSWRQGLPAPLTAPALVWLTAGGLLTLNLLALACLGLLLAHALHREPESDQEVDHKPRKPIVSGRAEGAAVQGTWSTVRLLTEITVTLGIALGGVIVMVQTGQAVALQLHLPAVVLSLVILAVATSLPNTIVAFILARTDRASASVEEIFSSNSVNAALGIALPLLFWSGLQNDRWLIFLDGPLMLGLTLATLFCVWRQRVSRLTGGLLLLVYLAWLLLHLFLW